MKKEQEISGGWYRVSAASVGQVNEHYYCIGEDEGYPIYSNIGNQNNPIQSCAVFNTDLLYGEEYWKFDASLSTYLGKGEAKEHLYYNTWL